MRIPKTLFASFFFILCALSSSWAAPKTCSDIIKALGHNHDMNQPNGNSYRQMPTVLVDQDRNGKVVTPDFTLDLVAHRDDPASASDKKVFVGDYLTGGVPYLAITPKQRTRAWVLDRNIKVNDGAGHLIHPSYLLPTDCLTNSELVYGGARWRVYQGETLKLNLKSELHFSEADFPDVNDPPTRNGGLTCNETNFHTHGLLVPPTATSPYGDYVLHSVVSPGAVDCKAHDMNHMAAHETPSAEMDFAINVPGNSNQVTGTQDSSSIWMQTGHHPPGVYWYHPHPHGYSRLQLNGGTTGMITIGELCDYATKTDSNGQTSCLLTPSEQQVHQRHIQFKDAQIGCAGDETACKANTGNWVMNTSYDPGLCPSNGDNYGECGQTNGPLLRRKWVFTVNGVQFPTIRDVEGQVEIWRLMNASPNVSYRLSLNPSDTDGKNVVSDAAQHLPFGILAVDGVAVANSGANQTDEILMMPGSRAEIVLRFSPSMKHDYVLVQNEVNGGGDTWPQINLLHVVNPVATNQTVALNNAQVAVDAKVQFNTNAPATSDVIKPLASKKLFAARVGQPHMCDFMPQSDVRYVRFVKRKNEDEKIDGKAKEIFGLIAGIGGNGLTDEPLVFDSATDTPLSQPLSQLWGKFSDNAQSQDTAKNFPAFGANPMGKICTQLGRSEIWILENWTDEIHNFHIHQSKFRYLHHSSNVAEDEFAPLLGPQAAGQSDADYHARLFQFPDIDPAGGSGAATDERIETGATAGFDGSMDALHDTLPVPRGQGINGGECVDAPDKTKCKPGRVALRIDFNRAEQAGNYVFHCHILEHEDLGMMAGIEVRQ
jgi:FtsP/CotA-like multicopper oxidase with cupredoxin domain